MCASCRLSVLRFCRRAAAAGTRRQVLSAARNRQVSLQVQQQVAQQEGLTQAGRVQQLEAAVRAVEQSRTKEVARPRRGRRRAA